jgi:hypothetical protein
MRPDMPEPYTTDDGRNVVKSYIIEVNDDGTINQRGFGWTYEPSLLIMGKCDDDGDVMAPWVVATAPWTSVQLGELLARTLDIALENPVDPGVEE